MSYQKQHGDRRLKSLRSDSEGVNNAVERAPVPSMRDDLCSTTAQKIS